MKKLMMTMLAAMMIVAASAQQVKTNIKVNGYESKAKIEAAAKAAPGVKQAIYNAKTKTVVVVYDKKKTAPAKIRTAVLKVDKKPVVQAKKTVAKKKVVKKKVVKKNIKK
ncbi:hypothetical protein SAMN05216455_103214 [Segatella bryantii]|jgi:hypothetical protein|uniref:hypothetical protein n=1 Tax=Segatella TaxID=2974251 RepID=UPI000488DB62|nr:MULTISPECIES: hypothetical protein [Segatella]SEA11408.1 hypothetical protein SAMN05216455_103214 [Segatella bryantii]